MSANPFAGFGYGPSEAPTTEPSTPATAGTAVFAGDVAVDMPESVRRAIADDQQRMRSAPDDTAVIDSVASFDPASAPASRNADVTDVSAEATDATDDAEAANDPREGAEDELPAEVDPIDAAVRRMRFIGSVAIIVALLALATMFAPFYRADIPEQTLRLRDGRQVELNAATVTVSAWDLTHQQAVQAPVSMSRAGSTAKHPASTAGIPQSHAMLLVVAMFAVAGYALRLTLPVGFSVIAGTFAFKQLTAMRSIVEHSRGGGEFITPQWGLSVYSMLLAVTMSLLISLTVQMFVTNLRERQAIRAEADARGETPPPTVFATVAGLIGRQAARFMEAGHNANDRDGDETTDE